MPASSTGPKASKTAEWEPIADPDGKFSSGIADLDRLLGGGFRRGSFSLYTLDGTFSLEELHLLFTPTWLNFLYQSRGLLAVLPAQESPSGFRARLLEHVSRRRFDSRVRIVDYVGEDDEAPYVTSLRGSWPEGPGTKVAARRTKSIAQMNAAEKAVQGARGRPYIELIALEIMESIAGPEKASRMFLFGVKRARQVGNLGIALARPGLGVVDAARSMMDYEFALRHTEVGLTIAGVRPAFPAHVVIPDWARGRPHVALIPTPPSS